MTPQEAMRSKFANDMSADDRPTLKMLLDVIAATAKKDETLRCADCVRNDRGLNWLADDILRTGGLEVKV